MYNITDKENKAYLKKIEKIKKSEEYIQNKMQIDCIKDILINHADVPEKLITWLIDAVEKNTMLISGVKINSTDSI